MLTTYALQHMGFRSMQEGERIAATFRSANVYCIQGLAIDESSVLSFRGELSDVPYVIAVGRSVNQATLAVLNDRYTEDEEAWARKHRCTPPYLVVLLGPTSEYSCTKGHIREENGQLLTYDCFFQAREELRVCELKVLPSLISALVSRFCNLHESVTLSLVDRARFGTTTTNQGLQDILFEMRASAVTVKHVAPEDLQAAGEDAVRLAATLNPKATRFFHLGLEEADPLKSFLYFFLSIEVGTHATFSMIDHGAHLAGMLKAQSRVEASTRDFFKSQQVQWRTLKDRFLWCALCEWKHLTDADIDEFKALKKVRDGIAHGVITSTSDERVAAARRLAGKLLLPTRTPNG